MEHIRAIGYSYGIRRRMMAILMLAIAWFLVGCQTNTVMIRDLKGADWKRYAGKAATVQGIFTKDPLPMLVTELKIVTVNMPMPFDQYLLLSGKEGDKIDPQKYGGTRMLVSGKVRKVKKEEAEYEGERVVLEVLSYKILEDPDVPYAPKVQHKKPDPPNP